MIAPRKRKAGMVGAIPADIASRHFNNDCTQYRAGGAK